MRGRGRGDEKREKEESVRAKRERGICKGKRKRRENYESVGEREK